MLKERSDSSVDKTVSRNSPQNSTPHFRLNSLHVTLGTQETSGLARHPVLRQEGGRNTANTAASLGDLLTLSPPWPLEPAQGFGDHSILSVSLLSSRQSSRRQGVGAADKTQHIGAEPWVGLGLLAHPPSHLTISARNAARAGFRTARCKLMSSQVITQQS